MIQIKDLEQRLVRYQKRCDELEIANGKFVEKFEQLDTDKREIIELLKRQEKQKTDEIVDLTDRLHGLHQTKQMEKEQYETQIHNLRNELDQVREQLTSENMILNGKLASLEEFRMQKDDLMAKFAMMENELEEMDKNHKQSIYELEKKQIIDKDRMKKDMFVRVDQLVSEFRKVSDKQMAETTKRTIRENVSITAQMSKMSDKTVELIEENDGLKAKEKKLLNKLKILEHNEKELTKKNLSGQKLINMLTEKCHELEDSLTVFQQRENEFEDKLHENEIFQSQIEKHKEETETVKSSLKDAQRKLEESQKETALLKAQNTKIEEILKDAADAIKNALSNMSKFENEDDLSAQVSQRDTMLQHLLWILNSSALLGLGPTAAELGKPPEKERATPEALKKLLLPPISSGTKGKEAGLAHYNLGDLGFVPRLSQQIPTSLDKMRSLIPVQQAGARRLFTRSIGVQTMSATKALFFAEKMLAHSSLSTKNPLSDARSLSSLITPPLISPKISVSIRNKAS